MKIKSKLRVVAILPICLVVAVICTMLFAAAGIGKALRLERAARGIVAEIYELTKLEHEVSGPLQHEKPTVSKWLVTHRQLGTKLGSVVVINPADQDILNRMVKDHVTIGGIFKDVYLNRRKAWAFVGRAAPTLEREKRLITTLMDTSRNFVRDANALAESADNAKSAALNRAAWSILIWTVILALSMGMISLFMTRSVTRSIAQLQRDTIAIGRGDLDHWVGVDANDEMGELSQNFQQMVVQLKSVTASRDDLNKEIAERKRTQSQLAQHDRLMREWLNVCTDGVWDWDLETNWQYMSPRLWELFGYRPEEKRHHPGDIGPLVHPDDGPAAFNEFFTHVRTKGEHIYRTEIRYRHKDGATVHVIRRGMVIEWGDDGWPKRMVGTHTDITKLKETETALRESEERFREMADNMRECVWLTSVDGHQILYINPAYETIWGRTVEQIYEHGEDWADAIHPDDRERVGKVFFEGAATNGFDQEYRIIRPEGEIRWIWDRGFPVRDSTGEIVHIAGIAEDITNRREQAVILQRRTDELARSNQELEQFAYVASHDLQEPLRKIEAFGELLLATCKDALPEQGRDYVERMQNASQRMHTLIEDVLRLARITIGPVTYQRVNLGDTVRDVLSDLEITLQTTKGHVEVGDLPVIEAEPVHMRQLMQNLIGNAIKFHRPDMPPHVKVYSEQNGQRPQFGNTDSGEDECNIVIEDNGIGFDEKYVERIFRVFQRLHRRDEFTGTGIGLAICQKILDLHGGHIAAGSEPGVGSRFVVTLPLRRAAVDRETMTSME